MAQPPVGSPFSQTEFTELGEYTKKGLHLGLKCPDGKILINFNDSTSTAMLKTVANIIKAEIVVIKGTWTFVPDTLEENEDE